MDEQKQKVVMRVKAFKETFSTESGKEVIKQLELVCNMKKCTYESDKINDLIFLEGQRNIYFYIQHMLDYDLAALVDENHKTVEY